MSAIESPDTTILSTARLRGVNGRRHWNNSRSAYRWKASILRVSTAGMFRARRVRRGAAVDAMNERDAGSGEVYFEYICQQCHSIVINIARANPNEREKRSPGTSLH